MAASIMINTAVSEQNGLPQQMPSVPYQTQANEVTIQLTQSENQTGHKITGTVSKDQTSKLVDQGNKILSATPTNVHYVYYDKLNRYYVQIEDSVTHQVLEEIPPKKLLDFAASIAEKLGLIVNKRI